jgi:carbamoyltransferase
MTPFMTTVRGIRPGREGALGAVRHVDGSARLQTVTEGSAPTLHRVLQEVERHTGVPAVLNTSLNGPGEPIVAGAADALGFFLAHPVDALLLGDLLFERGRA